MKAGESAAIETTQTTRFCPMCAAPMRPRASFCHRCGKPYPEESTVVYQGKESKTAPTNEEFEEQWDALTNNNSVAAQTEQLSAQKEILNDRNNQIALESSAQDERADADISNKNETAADFPQTVSDETSADAKVAVNKPAPKTRVKHRVVQTTTEYVWEESVADPTWRFVIATIIILIFVFFVLWFGNFIHF